ncbi:MAG: hypothetical protein IH598_15670 [Bacteroidales bacterium]|nr:hypothetical protein [Bacteroidales bacterium]
MEPLQVKPTVIEVKKKFENIVVSYLQTNTLNYKVIPSENPKRIKIQVENLDSTEAFRLGAHAQVQLVDGEYLI